MSTHTLEAQASAVAAGAGSIVPVFGGPERRIEIHASKDGFPLAASLYEPRKFENGIGVIVAPAYATPRRHYAAYAKYLSSLGFTVVTFDYRGVGGSHLQEWQGEAPVMRHWGERDLAGVIDWMGRHYPHLRLVQVGHSAGGQMLGLAPNNTQVAALLAVASQSGYWQFRDGWYRPLTWVYFRAMIPFMAHFTSWFPRFQRGGYAVPKGVALEFARWGRNPHYIIDNQGRPDREGFHRYRGQVRLYHITDDHDFAPRRAVEALAGFYANARTEIVHSGPDDWSVNKIGHFGFFRAQMPRSAWFETALWLSSVAAPRRQRMEDSGQPEHALCA
jgi:predicted alpha/beta hydrolase